MDKNTESTGTKQSISQTVFESFLVGFASTVGMFAAFYAWNHRDEIMKAVARAIPEKR